MRKLFFIALVNLACLLVSVVHASSQPSDPVMDMSEDSHSMQGTPGMDEGKMSMKPGSLIEFLLQHASSAAQAVQIAGAQAPDLIVRLTIDPGLQATAQRSCATTLASDGERVGVHQGALVLLAPDGGDPRPGRRRRPPGLGLQPRDPGPAPAGLGVQAVRLRRGAGNRGQADRHPPGRADALRALVARPTTAAATAAR